MLFGYFGVHFLSYEGSGNGKLKKARPKGTYKEKCIGWHKMTTFSGKPNAFGHSEVHFWSYEGGENGKLKQVGPKGNYKEECLGWHKMTTFSENPNAFWPF